MEITELGMSYVVVSLKVFDYFDPLHNPPVAVLGWTVENSGCRGSVSNLISGLALFETDLSLSFYFPFQC